MCIDKWMDTVFRFTNGTLTPKILRFRGENLGIPDALIAQLLDGRERPNESAATKIRSQHSCSIKRKEQLKSTAIS